MGPQRKLHLKNITVVCVLGHKGQDWLRGRPLLHVYDLDLDLNNCEASDVQICGFNLGYINCGVDSSLGSN